MLILAIRPHRILSSGRLGTWKIRIFFCERLSGLPGHYFPGICDFLTFNILVKSHQTVYDAAGGDFYNPVYQGIYELVVMGGEKNHLLEFEQAVV